MIHCYNCEFRVATTKIKVSNGVAELCDECAKVLTSNKPKWLKDLRLYGIKKREFKKRGIHHL